MQSPPPVTATIAFVSNNCWSLYHFRGSVMRHFIRRGFRVVAIAEQDDYTELVREMGCVYHPLGIRNSSLSPVNDLKLLVGLHTIYSRESPSAIFHYVTKPCIYGSFVAGNRNIPSISVITGLGYVYSGGNWLSKLVSFMFRNALDRANEVWFLNRDNATFFTERNIIGREKVKILPGEGIDTDYFRPVKRPGESRPFVFLMVSRLLWSKGIGTFMEAAGLVREKVPDAEFRLAGRQETGHPEAIPESYLRQWVEKGMLVNLGFTRDVRAAISEADCLVLPTYYEEGIPMALMEACSMAVPVITTDHTGCNTVVEDGFNGMLCRSRDAVGLADHMLRMIRMKKEDRDRMGNNGRERMVSRFDISRIIDIYDDALFRLCGL